MSALGLTKPSSRLRPLSVRHSVVAANFVAFLVMSAGAFQPQNNMTFFGLDGEFTRGASVQAIHFADAFPALPVAIFEGMGTILQYNPVLTPSLLPLGFISEHAAVWLSYIVCAGLMFGTTYCLGRALGMTRGVALFASWLLPLLSLPYHASLATYPVYDLNTGGADTISMVMLGLSILARGYGGSHLYRSALGIFLIVVWNFLANPLWILIPLPTACTVGLGIIATNARQPGFLHKTVWLILPSVIFVALGGGPYLIGLFVDTAAYFFRQEMNVSVAHSWRLVSVVSNGAGIDKVGAAWAGLGLAGIVFAIRGGRHLLRSAAFSTLVSIVLFAAFSASYLSSPTWAYPYPVYFEFALWPFYSLFAAYFVGAIISYLTDERTRLKARIGFLVRTPRRVAGLLLFAGTTVGVGFAYHPFRLVPDDLIRQPIETKITTGMHSAAIAPGEPFSGYVASLTGFGGLQSSGTDWFGLLSESNGALAAFGNPERMPYLWRFGLSTLEEYSEMTEPAFYAVVTRLLNRPGDRQTRNITFISRANAPLLQSLGVRFIVADYQLPAPAQLITQQADHGLSHFLYELPDPNLGSYSPTEIGMTRTATGILQLIADPNFDFHKKVILDRNLDSALSRADSGNITLIRGGWRVRAESRTTSLLLLPVQFSSCLSVHDDSGDGGQVIAVLRANLVETALLFSGSIDATLALRVSPFRDPYCRIRDAKEARQLGLAEIPINIVPDPSNPIRYFER